MAMLKQAWHCSSGLTKTFRDAPPKATFRASQWTFSFLFRYFAANEKQNEYEQEETLQTIPAPVGHAISSDIRKCTEWHERL